MPSESDPLSFLDVRDRTMLHRMALANGRTDVEELRQLIRRRACGAHYDLGDGRIKALVSEEDLPKTVEGHFVKAELETEPSILS